MERLASLIKGLSSQLHTCPSVVKDCPAMLVQGAPEVRGPLGRCLLGNLALIGTGGDQKGVKWSWLL